MNECGAMRGGLVHLDLMRVLPWCCWEVGTDRVGVPDQRSE